MATDYAANIAALEEALGSGELMVQMPDGRRIQYRDVDELKSAIAYNRKQLTAGSGKSKTTYATFGST